MGKLGVRCKTMILCWAFMLTLAGCAGWQVMTYSQKADATLAYYRTFSKGLSNAADFAVYMKPELAGPVAAGKVAIQILDANLAALSERLHTNAGLVEVNEQLKIIDGSAQAANAVVGSITASVDGFIITSVGDAG